MKVNGQWWFHYGYYSNNTLTKKSKSGAHADRFRARQRVRTQVQFIADENLSALLNLENNLHWGDANGGGLDADKATFTVKHAYLDWTPPSTQTRIRMGMQGLRLPWVNFGNPIMDADVAGVTVASQLTPELGLTVFWARPYDTDYYNDAQATGKNTFDEMDMFGFTLPITTDVVRATPWGMIALIGKDSGWWGTEGIGSATGSATGANYSGRGRAPVNPGKIDSTSWAWWAGTTFELPVLDPFFVKIDAMMGGLRSGDKDTNAFGWLASGDIGYKFNFGALSAIGWYSSGDKKENDRGIMPIISDDGGFGPTRYGTAGSTARSFDRLITGTGLGMWGLGLQLADVSFVDNLTHTARAVYMKGTNQGGSVPVRSVSDAIGDARFGKQFLMSSDSAWEVNLLNEYMISQNLKFNLDFAYLWLDLGKHWTDRKDTTGSFATMLGVTYSF